MKTNLFNSSLLATRIIVVNLLRYSFEKPVNESKAFEDVGLVPDNMHYDKNKPYNGSLRYFMSNDFLLDVKDTRDGSKLVQDNGYCNQIDVDGDGVNDLFCSYLEVWNATNGKNRSHFSFIPPDTNVSLQQAECCEQGECWKGTDCVGERSIYSIDKEGNVSTWICSNGKWRGDAHLKWKWNYTM